MNYYGYGARVEVLTKLSPASSYGGKRLRRGDYATRTFVNRESWKSRNWSDKTIELAWIDDLFPERRAPASELAARIALGAALGIDPKRVGKLSTTPESGSSFVTHRRGGGGGARAFRRRPLSDERTLEVLTELERFRSPENAATYLKSTDLEAPDLIDLYHFILPNDRLRPTIGREDAAEAVALAFFSLAMPNGKSHRGT